MLDYFDENDDMGLDDIDVQVGPDHEITASFGDDAIEILSLVLSLILTLFLLLRPMKATSLIARILSTSPSWKVAI